MESDLIKMMRKWWKGTVENDEVIDLEVEVME